ncbi:MAG TPA: DUF2461 domain-containing protein [Saprospiraceae bacterium]|nr:DUF2461 domain-containing protein [Saprospiraceae bacterium]
MRIESATLRFLKELEKHNNREWFTAHKDQYDAALANVNQFRDAVVQQLSKKDAIEDGRVFRIYRDVRFSKDKAPYKNNFGIHFTRSGKERRGGYYLHLQPGETFAGGGFWAPEPHDLKRIRDEIEFDDKPIRKIVSNKTFVKYFGTLNGDELKTAPSGYDRDHPAIDLLRKKQFIIGRKFKDKEVNDPLFLKEVILSFEAMRPFFDYMSEVLSTDVNGQII